VKRARAASAAWTALLVACATAALIGIISFMLHVQRSWHDGGAATGPPEATMPAVERERPAPSSAASRPPTDTRKNAGAPDAPTPAALDTHVAHLRARKLTIPVAGVRADALVASFAEARGERVHEALDIMADAGTPVVAVEDGTVAKLFTSKAGGLTIYQFDRAGTVAYYYAHLQGYAPGLEEGDTLRRGQVVGYVGSTGNANPAAPHLHFAIFLLGPEKRWSEGTAIDPYPVLR
jgi:murein DD-endopeptidase MepM/ murein hydrolase activator NlpD